MSVVAISKDTKISPRKADLVASLVRGRSVADALVILEHTPKKGALIITKVIKSAQANATHNHQLKEDGLMLTELSIGPGTALKRFKPVAFGRAHPYKHRTSNIRVVVDGQAQAKPAKADAKTKSANKPAKTKAEKK